MNKEDFELLLAWLDPDRDQAGREYEKIRRGLIKLFVCRGCTAAEELADLTIDRVCRKVSQIAPGYEGQPGPYFFKVAKYILLEYGRKSRKAVPIGNPNRIPSPGETKMDEKEDTRAYEDCLSSCLKKLPTQNRALIVDYYRCEKARKIALRKRLARRIRISTNALRIKMFRIRKRLEKCVLGCVGSLAGQAGG